MATRRGMGWQKESLALMAGVLSPLLLLTFGAAAFASSLNTLAILDVPAGLFVLSILNPVVLTLLALWFVLHQAAIDRKYHRVED